jgi:hypothetical protein
MIIRLTTAAVVYALITTLIVLRPATGLRALGLFGVNGTLTALAPQTFVELARQAARGRSRGRFAGRDGSDRAA